EGTTARLLYRRVCLARRRHSHRLGACARARCNRDSADSIFLGSRRAAHACEGAGTIGGDRAQERCSMTDIAWIDAALTAARPQVVAALLRYFRSLDTAEEAFQEASLRALKVWPANGPPRDPAARLIFVARNFAVDEARKSQRHDSLPDEAAISDTADAQPALAARLDNAHYRDDILRLLSVCCHPELPSTPRIALPPRAVSGLSVPAIPHGFLVRESAMQQRITRAKRRVAAAQVPVGKPWQAERQERLNTVAAMILLLSNEG